ncbi:MAG: PIG-L deacetylase family protein [Chloroherpetonaceae bacterium]|nr:PIG-L family deacetylase [Chthonomonadaceae bacterium]MDW8208323.1 PIG-L deacetylase family protein [Chloroherpetonaceae bacterium]
MPQRYVLCIGAHPDDNELSVGGTAARFRRRGDVVRFLSVTNGDKGHFAPEYLGSPERLADRRQAEAENAAAVIGAEYQTLGLHDGEVYVHLITTERMIRAIRSFGPPGRGPDLVLLNRPQDYHRDHRYTAQLVLDATYMLTVPMICPDVPHLERMPVFAYWHDDFTEGGRFRADVVVPIDDVIEYKIDMAAAHVSQVFEWLPYNAGRLEQVPPATDPAARRQMIAGRIRAEGERQRTQTQELLERQYGPNTVQYVEAFQICEYGRVPDATELRELFPLHDPAGHVSSQ